MKYARSDLGTTCRIATNLILSFLLAVGIFVSLATSASGNGSKPLLGVGITVSIQQGSETSPPAGYLRVENNNNAVKYTGPWTVMSSSLLTNYSGGTADVSSASNSTATLTFNGSAVRWIGYSDTLSGIANVTLDGGNQTVVNSYATLPESQVMLYSASGLDPTKTHTLTIEVTGRHSLLALGSKVTVDAFDILPPPPDTTPPNVAISGERLLGVRDGDRICKRDG